MSGSLSKLWRHCCILRTLDSPLNEASIKASDTELGWGLLRHNRNDNNDVKVPFAA